MSKSTKTTNSTQTTTPAASPDLRFALDQNRELFNSLQGREAFPGQTYADFSPETTQALDLISQRALNGSPLTGAAQGAAQGIAQNGFLTGDVGNYISNMASGGGANAAAQYFLPTAQGNYLDFANNPYFQTGASAINDSVGSIFERAGRTGSGANQSSVAKGIGEFGAGVYNQERSNQLNASQALANIYNQDTQNAYGAAGLLGQNANAQLSAASLAPQLAGMDYADLQALASVGAQKEGQTQKGIDEALWRYNFPYENQIQAQNLLNSGVGGLGPLLGGTTTGQQTETSSPGLFNSIMGGLLTAGSLAAGMPGLGGMAGGGSGGGGGGSSGFVNPYAYLAGGNAGGGTTGPF